MIQAGGMSQELESVFRELGISQYLDIFVEQGFDSWETILDIQESDLDALGVKLGHRRKLQRRIANARGVAPSTSLPASTARFTDEDSKQPIHRADQASIENGAEYPIVTKRKYRRHPKADENGPERPPSAYVLFSNKLREGLKGQTLTFTEIAKLVGEQWQNLPAAERERYETQANVAKERYHVQMASYKRSAEYQQYMKYLQDFKEKQTKPSQGQETAKRPRLEQAQLAAENGHVGGNAVTGSAASIASGSSISERMRGSESGEPRSSQRHDSVTSVTSATESRSSSTAPQSTASVSSPTAALAESTTPKRGPQRHLRRTSSTRGSTRRTDAAPQALPPISAFADNIVGFGGPPSVDGHAFKMGFNPANARPSLHSGPPAFAANHTSMLPYESLPGGSSASTEKMFGFSRRSSDAPLAIHALLSDPNASAHPGYARSSTVVSATSPIEVGRPLFGQHPGPRGYGYQNPIAAFQHMRVEDPTDGDVIMSSAERPANIGVGDGKCRLDGMNALLRAGEIVGRFPR